MRTVDDAASVRLYHLDAESGAVTTLLYGSMAEALRVAAAQPAEMQAELFLQTDNDVIGYLELDA